MEKEKLFKDEKYYRWKKESINVIVFHGENKYVTHGEVVKGSRLNEAINDLRLGCKVDWEELDTKDLDGAIEKIENLTLERCFEILPDPNSEKNVNDYYPYIQAYSFQRGFEGWHVSIRDWCGMRDQACIYSAISKNMLHALQDCIVFLVARGIISKEVL